MPKITTPFILLPVLAMVLLPSGIAADETLEQLKRAASSVSATLNVEEAGKTLNKDNALEMEYLEYIFTIDTGTRFYKLIYRTFPDENAAENPDLLTDGGSGYGMLEPNKNWYWQGFITAFFKGVAGSDIRRHQGRVRILETDGNRIGFDLVYEMPGGIIVIRTTALAGRDELFVSVMGSGAGGELEVSFRGYPLGFDGPFDRWIHTASEDIRNRGTENAAFPLEGAADPWVLLTDHGLAGSSSGQLGLAWAKEAVKHITVTHSGNYGIDLTFIGEDDAQEQRFVVVNFVDEMTWQEARERMSELSQAAPTLMERALSHWESQKD